MEPTTADAFAEQISLEVRKLVQEMRQSRHAKILEAMGFCRIKVATPDEDVSDECIFFANDHETVAVDEFADMWHVGAKVDLSRLGFSDVSAKLQSIMDRLPPPEHNN